MNPSLLQPVEKATSQSTVLYSTTSSILETGKEGSFYNSWVHPSPIMNYGQYQGECTVMQTSGAPIGLDGVKEDSHEEVEPEIDGGIPDAFSASLKQIETFEEFLTSSNPIIDLCQSPDCGLETQPTRNTIVSKGAKRRKRAGKAHQW